MRASRKLRMQLVLQKALFTALLLAVMGMLGWLTRSHNVQYDWTENKRNTLSETSMELLHTLDKPVTLNIYVQDDDTVRTAVSEIMQRYQRVKPDFQFSLINPDIDYQAAQEDQVTNYGQVVIKYDGRRETVTSLNEQTLSSALLRLSRPAHKIVFLEGHGERNPASTDNGGYGTLTTKLQASGFKVLTHNLLRGELPQDTSVLVIAAPDMELLEGETGILLDYLAKGGNLLWLMDPGPMQGLEALAEAAGVYFLGGIVVDNNINLRQTLRIEHPAIIPVLDYHEHPITRGADYNSLFPFSRGIDAAEGEAGAKWNSQVIAQSLPRSWLETSPLTDEIVFEEAGDTRGPVALVIANERLATGEMATTEKASQRVVAVADSDFLTNSYIGAGANLVLGQNIISWLAGDDDLIAVEPKSATDLQLKLDDTEVFIIGIGFFLALPAALVIAGVVVWLRRRKR